MEVNMVNAEIKERYDLVKERIAGIILEDTVDAKYREYFVSVSKYILYNLEIYEKLLNGDLDNASIEALEEINKNLYKDIIGDCTWS
jgi:hypothetical protein